MEGSRAGCQTKMSLHQRQRNTTRTECESASPTTAHFVDSVQTTNLALRIVDATNLYSYPHHEQKMQRTAFLSCKESTDKTLPIGFLCKYLSNPSVTVTRHPSLKWEINTAQNEFRQSAYHVIVGINSARISNGNEALIDAYHNNTGTLYGPGKKLRISRGGK